MSINKDKKNTIKKIISICDICLKEIPAVAFLKNGRVFIEKNCKEHGKFVSEHIWDDPEIYRRFSRTQPLQAQPTQAAVILTNKCNLDCPICLASANEKKDPDFKFEELDRIKDYEAVLLTGGEPTVRDDLPLIIKRLKRRNRKVILLSNGVRLADENYVKMLKKAGLGGVRLQFDSLGVKDNLYIRGRNLLEEKKTAIENLRKSKVPVVICVLVINKNFNSLKKMLRFALNRPGVKSISLNPLWKLGRYDERDFVSSSKIVEKTSFLLGLKKKDWIESTVFLMNLDKFISIFKERKRTFCMCNLKCLLLPHKGAYIPITKIFDLETLNKKMDRLYKNRSCFGILHFFLYFLTSQLILNFFINQKFRSFLFQSVSRIKFFLKKDFVSLNPFFPLSVESFMTESNFDLEVSDGCNFQGYSPNNFVAKAACLNRINSSKEALERLLKK